MAPKNGQLRHCGGRIALVFPYCSRPVFCSGVLELLSSCHQFALLQFTDESLESFPLYAKQIIIPDFGMWQSIFCHALFLRALWFRKNGRFPDPFSKVYSSGDLED